MPSVQVHPHPAPDSLRMNWYHRSALTRDMAGLVVAGGANRPLRLVKSGRVARRFAIRELVVPFLSHGPPKGHALLIQPRRSQVNALPPLALLAAMCTRGNCQSRRRFWWRCYCVVGGYGTIARTTKCDADLLYLALSAKRARGFEQHTYGLANLLAHNNNILARRGRANAHTIFELPMPEPARPTPTKRKT